MKHLLPIALTVLLLACCTTPGEYRAMRHGLDSINGLNRSDRPFSPADVQPYVSYFDRHGSGNDRLLAHYLLGRAYHEQGEAPMALQCYQEALAAADTTAAECDYSQLSRVYGQMGDIFYKQGLYREQFGQMKNAVKYAWHAKDTLSALMYYEQESVAYRYLGKADSAIIVAEKVADLFELYGYSSDAAITLGSIVHILILEGDMITAKAYMDRYESKSGRFNEEREIVKGREYYYRVKGLYCFYTQQLDSAEYWYRKELHDGRDFNNQNAGSLGLAAVFGKRHQPDSAAKYFQYAYAMNDSMHVQKTTGDIERMQSMYDYTRHQEAARQAEIESGHNKAIWQWGGTIAVTVLLIILHITYRIKSEHKKVQLEYEHSKQTILRIQKEIDQANREVRILKATHDDAIHELIEEKERQIESLNAKLYQAEMDSSLFVDETQLSKAEDDLRNSPEYLSLLHKINKGTSLSEDWLMLEGLLQSHFPVCYRQIQAKRYLLSDDEYKTCILVRLHVAPVSISYVIGKTEGSITNIRIRLLNKLFGESGKAKTFDAKICKIC